MSYFWLFAQYSTHAISDMWPVSARNDPLNLIRARDQLP